MVYLEPGKHLSTLALTDLLVLSGYLCTHLWCGRREARTPSLVLWGCGLVKNALQILGSVFPLLVSSLQLLHERNTNIIITFHLNKLVVTLSAF